jgi:hypothetical protein
LKERLITYYSIEAGFSAMLAAGNAQKDDIPYVTGQIVRSISSLTQWISALNEQYCLNEKKAVRMIDHFPIHPDGYKKRVDHIFTLAGENQSAACQELTQLVGEVQELIRIILFGEHDQVMPDGLPNSLSDTGTPSPIRLKITG